MQISGVPVGIFPARINNAAVVGYVRKDGMTVIDEDLLINAGLKTPFDEECLKEVCETATRWLEDFDLAGIE